MNKSIIKIKLSHEQIKIKVKLEGEPCSSEGEIYLYLRHQMLQSLIDNPSLMLCELVPFQKMIMIHNGERWIIELEAIINNKKG